MCCGLRIICEDGKVLVSRTLEFGININYKSHKTENIKGVKGFINDPNDSYFIDGVNKDGLVVMAFYYQNYDEYSKLSKNGFYNLDSLQVVDFLLNNCKSIDDIKKISKKMNVLNTIYEPLGIVFPLHWFCSDKFGNCIVIEYKDEKPVIYDNPFGIMTNSPTFPEHLKYLNLERVQKLSPKNNPQKADIQGKSIDTILHPDYSNGTGMIGLPGDYSSISRFIKLYILQKFCKPPKCIHDGITTCLHILNNFDILKGTSLNNDNREIYTQYTIIYDPNSSEAYFKTYENQMISRL